MNGEQRTWLKTHRCPTCAKRRQAACPYEVYPRVTGGFVCKGYRADRRAR